MRNKKILIGFILSFILIPSLVLAHQPRIVESRQISVPDPEISKAYYGQLAGEPDVYTIQAKTAFDFKETKNALTLIPQLKKNFFNKSAIEFIKSPFGWGLLIVMYVLAFIFGFLYRFILKRFTKGTVRGVNKNINKSGRLIRLFIGLALLALAITTSWNPILIFFSGFCIFESIFSWCGFYAAIGKNTCPIN